LERSSRSGGDATPFLLYALQGFVDGLRGQLEEIRHFQHRTMSLDYVREVLRSEGSTHSAEVRTRQQQLVTALSEKKQPVPQSEIKLLTPEIAQAYARKTPKTVSRDLNALRELGLIEIGRNGVRALTETILSFLPPKKIT
jgi:CRP-like cAMP-binding protein